MSTFVYQEPIPPWNVEHGESHGAWQNSLLLPIPFVGLSFFYILAIFAFRSSKRNEQVETNNRTVHNGGDHPKEDFLTRRGGLAIFTFRIARLLGCVAMFAISTYQLIEQNASNVGGWRRVWALRNVPQLSMIATYWYTSILALLSLGSGYWSSKARAHVVFILLVVFGVYSYRDFWPLATYTLTPKDGNEDPILLYTKLTILTVSAVLVPLFIPREYKPLDPKHPMQVPNPEQTASIFSLTFTYGFLNPVFREASHVAHMPFSRFPPLADYDRSAYLKDKAFPYIDQFQKKRKTRIYWGFLRVFAYELGLMTISTVIYSFSYFLSPWALNRLLAYLEGNGTSDVIVKPWFWLVCLFVGPLTSTLTSEWYNYVGTAVMIRMEGILTQLIFEHSLRVRFKAEVSKPAAGQNAEEGDDDSDRKGSGKKENIVGKINTLIMEDVDNMIEARDFLKLAIQVPMQFAVALVFLYAILGWSALVGFASIVLLLPVPGYVANKMDEFQQDKMSLTDARVQSVSEAVGALRMVKLFAWEKAVSDDIKEKRDKELRAVWKNKLLDSANTVVNAMIPTSTMILTYATYTLVMKKELNASIVFSSMVVFDTLRGVLRSLSHSIRDLIQSKVSFDRMEKFLRETELLDDFDETIAQTSSVNWLPTTNTEIGFKDAHFVWSSDDASGPATPSGRAFRLKVDGRLTFKPGCLNVVVGPTGSGKTSILMALLGEMHHIPAAFDSWYSLPRSGGVAYAAQESWVQNQTIKENILFGSPYDEERYKKVLRQCALTRDLDLFEAGDNTEVGEKGLTLSGGQKARVTLARAVYSPAEIVLLDDVLAALDVHTAKWIVKECLQGDLLRGRTVILATHNIPLVAPIASFFVSVDINGVARDAGTSLSTALALDPLLDKEVHEQEEEISRAEEKIDDDTGETKGAARDGKLVLAEEIAVGHVARRAFMLFFRALGGRMPFLFIGLWIFGMVCVWGFDTFSVWFLGYWSTQYQTHNPEDISVPFYLSIYSGILVAALLIGIATELFYTFRSQQASRTINGALIDSVLRSTLRWLDQTPVARILARCTQDIAVVDGPFPARVETAGTIIVCMTIKLAAPVLFTPLFIIPGILVAIVGVFIGNTYLKAQLSVKREMSNSRSPLLAHFGAAISGLTSIRAYGAQEAFTNETLSRIDNYTRCARTSNNLNRWLSVRMDMLGAILTTSLATYLLIWRPISAADIGFSLTQALEFCTMIMVIVRVYNGLEVQANNLERIQAYLDIEHEPQATDSGKPPAAWPKSGKLNVEHLSSRYSENGPNVLHDISFKVESGQRIGIVGRTGSGKTSLTLALLRCIPTEGQVYYDEMQTNKLNLDALRSSITIIPQIPELLSGTLRRNLDPFGQYHDAQLNDALRDAGLFSLQDNMDEGRLTLDSEIAGGGGNLSVGQRQIIALARAIVRSSKLLILDEATSAVDHETDAVIQSTLRTRLAADATVLTIAHRLQSIMDSDKIMVLDEGKIIEFDSPANLLQKSKSVFKAMVDGSKDRRSLYAVLEGQARV